MADRSAKVFGLRLDLLDMKGAVERCRELVESGVPAQQSSINAGKVVLTLDSPQLKAALNRADVLTADGQSVVWAGRLLGIDVPERVSGIDLMERLIELAEQRAYPVYFLGAREDVLARFLEVVTDRYPRLALAGAEDGYYHDEAATVERIRLSGAKLLFIAVPSPMKELFVERNRDALGPLLAVGVGGSFDVWAGITSRAPQWMQRSGLEWFYRLIQEPRRMWRRYLVGNTRFILLTFRELLSKRGI